MGSSEMGTSENGAVVGRGAEKRVVVVGASTGLGRCIGTGLAQRGSTVALLARRLDKLEEAAKEAGGGAVIFACDAVDQRSAAESIGAAAAAMGGIDTVIYTPAIGAIEQTRRRHAGAVRRRPSDERDRREQHQSGSPSPPDRIGREHDLHVNDRHVEYTDPWVGLGVYQVTKAAMNRLVDHWRVEQPGINFTLVTIGECPGGQGDRQTQFNVDWDMELVGQITGDWFERKLISRQAFIDVEHLVDQFHALVTMGLSLQVPSMVIIPRPPVPRAGDVAASLEELQDEHG